MTNFPKNFHFNKTGKTYLLEEPQLTKVFDVHVLELLRIGTLVVDTLLAKAPLLVDLAVRREGLVGIGANLAARIRLVAAVLDALAFAEASHLVRVASTTRAASDLSKTGTI